MKTLERLLTDEIRMAEHEKAELEEKIKQLNQKILAYKTAQNYARGVVALHKRARYGRFQQSPRQLIAHILKTQPEKWLHTDEITLQVMELDSQSVENGVLTSHRQSIHSILNNLAKHALIDKKLKGYRCYWRVKSQ